MAATYTVLGRVGDVTGGEHGRVCGPLVAPSTLAKPRSSVAMPRCRVESVGTRGAARGDEDAFYRPLSCARYAPAPGLGLG